MPGASTRAAEAGTFAAIAALATLTLGAASCAALSGLEDLAPVDDAAATGGDGQRADDAGDDATASGDGTAGDAILPGDAPVDGKVSTCPAICPTGSACLGTICNVNSKSSCTSPIVVPASGATFQVQICATDATRPTLQCADAAAAPTPSAIFEVGSSANGVGGGWRVQLSTLGGATSGTIELTTVDAQCTQKAGACSTLSGGSTTTGVAASSYVAVGLEPGSGGPLCVTVQLAFTAS